MSVHQALHADALFARGRLVAQQRPICRMDHICMSVNNSCKMLPLIQSNLHFLPRLLIFHGEQNEKAVPLVGKCKTQRLPELLQRMRFQPSGRACNEMKGSIPTSGITASVLVCLEVVVRVLEALAVRGSFVNAAVVLPLLPPLELLVIEAVKLVLLSFICGAVLFVTLAVANVIE